MNTHYSNLARESEEHALPDVEVWFHQHGKRELCCLNAGRIAERFGECVLDDEDDCRGTGWYWCPCFPGCLPDGEANGPFETKAEALADAQQVDDYDYD